MAKIQPSAARPRSAAPRAAATTTTSTPASPATASRPAPSPSAGPHDDHIDTRSRRPPLGEARGSLLHGANASPARRAYELGRLAFEVGRLDDAIRHFERGYALTRRPEFLFNIARSYVGKGETDRAAHVLELCRGRQMSAPQRAKIDALVARIARSPQQAAVAGRR